MREGSHVAPTVAKMEAAAANRVAVEHQPEQHDQRDEQMPAFAQDFARRRDVLGGKPLEAELAGLEVHRHEQREII